MRTYRWRLVLGVVILVVGVVALWNSLDIEPRIDASVLSPLLLIALGVYLVFRHTSRTRGVATGSELIDRIIGDVRLGSPGALMKSSDVLALVGDVDIDLRGVAVPDGETTIRVRSLVGDIDVLVPGDVAISASAFTAIGNLRLLDRRRDGFLEDLAVSTPDYATATRKVCIEADMLIGDVDVRRA